MTDDFDKRLEQARELREEAEAMYDDLMKRLDQSLSRRLPYMKSAEDRQKEAGTDFFKYQILMMRSIKEKLAEKDEIIVELEAKLNG